MGSVHRGSGQDAVESCKPAPYGGACSACSRAKCKCFYRTDGSGCERCHRLGKICEPSNTVRKRKARDGSPPLRRLSPPSRGLLEEKLDDLVTLLRSQATAGRESQDYKSSPSSIATSPESRKPNALNAVLNPDVVLDTVETFIDLLRPPESQTGYQDRDSDMGPSSPIFHDVEVHHVPDLEAEDRLNIFRRAFIPTFPFVHLPPAIHSAELRRQKPFLWLVIMSLTDRVVDRQFAMEETIWKIISHRIVTQHHADLDSLLAIICFSNWSHYYKQETPFMNMLTQLALTVAFELDLNKESHSASQQGPRYGRTSSRSNAQTDTRTLEERRAYVALVKLTSTTWEAYRKFRPLGWTPYLGKCLRILAEMKETKLDASLAAQVNCQIFINPILYPSSEETGEESKGQPITRSLFAASIRNIQEIKRGLLPELLASCPLRLYFTIAELKLRDRFLNTTREARDPQDQLQRIQDLEATMECVERCLSVINDMPLEDWVGVTVDKFSEFMHCLIALFKLTTLNEPLWDTEEVRKRADVLQLMDKYCETMSRVAVETRMVDAELPRKGLFFKGPSLLRAIRALMAAEMSNKESSSAIEKAPAGDHAMEIMPDVPFDVNSQNNFLINLDNEPWLSDLFIDSWALDLDATATFI
ncbi:unnamed protein product [Clonostachys rosea f. rosea IK726]|uniref:Zn(2)-C6 fungal-type domain-containing protein n=2 Tax=Bionectria ochroleuca TaxID=29856 RepID=A0A0B7K9T3_BIOOC|nr:unnamed protein product [Clonostachys rosea f. rosea IK726]